MPTTEELRTQIRKLNDSIFSLNEEASVHLDYAGVLRKRAELLRKERNTLLVELGTREPTDKKYFFVYGGLNQT